MPKLPPKVSFFDLKIDPWTVKSRLLGRFGTFLGDVEKSSYFDVALVRQKIEKIELWGAQGPPRGLRAVGRSTL